MEENDSNKGQHHTAVTAALFDDFDQAEAAVSELEKSHFSREQIGMAFPKESRQPSASPPPDKDAPEKRGVIFAGAPTAGFPGWTMGMAPWTFAGVGPMVVLGSLSTARHHDDGPEDLPALLVSLGLHEDVYGQVEQGFQRGRILVTVDARGSDAIAASILSRNGGHSLRRE